MAWVVAVAYLNASTSGLRVLLAEAGPEGLLWACVCYGGVCVLLTALGIRLTMYLNTIITADETADAPKTSLLNAEHQELAESQPLLR